MSPLLSTSVGMGMVWSPPRSQLPCGPRRRSIRHVRTELDQNTTFSERLVSGAQKGFEKEKVSPEARKRFLPSLFASPRSQWPDMPLPPHGAVHFCWPPRGRFAQSPPESLARTQSCCFFSTVQTTTTTLARRNPIARHPDAVTVCRVLCPVQEPRSLPVGVLDRAYASSKHLSYGRQVVVEVH